MTPESHPYPTVNLESTNSYERITRLPAPVAYDNAIGNPSLIDGPATHKVAREVLAERERQDTKWGQQNHPDGTGPMEYVLPDIEELRVARASDLTHIFRNITDARAKMDTVTWRDILLEEVFEALAESDPTRLREELLQVSAVAQAWAEHLDRREESARQAGALAA